jgi:ribonuclease I
MIMAIMSSIISLTLIYISFHGVGVAADTQLPQSPITFLPPSPLYYQSDSPLLEEPKGKKNKPPRTRPPRNPPPAPHHPPPPPPVPTFDHFKLSLTWPLTFCKLPGVKCDNEVPLRLTIHGLWPNNKDTQLKDCDKQKRIPVNWLKVSYILIRLLLLLLGVRINNDIEIVI